MSILEFLLYVLTVLGLLLFIYHLLKMERRYDRLCAMGAYFTFWGFVYIVFFSILIGRFDFVPGILSSLVIALLTLSLVWVELSKRPELKLGDFVPIIRDKQTVGVVFKAGYHDEEPEPSRFLKVREVSVMDRLKFNEDFSFSVDLSNIGYGEIMVHEYTFEIDGKREKPIPLGSPHMIKRLRLITQQRHPIDMPRLYIKSAGFHKIHVTFSGMTIKCSKEVWFFISPDFKKLRYVEMPSYKHLLSTFIKNKLKDP